MPNYSLNCFHLKKIRKKTCYLNPTKTSFKKHTKEKTKEKVAWRRKTLIHTVLYQMKKRDMMKKTLWRIIKQKTFFQNYQKNT